MPSNRPMHRLLLYLGQYKNNLRSSVLSSITNKIFDLMPPFLTAWIIDTVSGNTPRWIQKYTGLEELWPIVIFLAVLTFLVFGVESFFQWLFQRGFRRLAQKVQHDLRMETYQKLQQREIAYFERERTGNLMAIINDDVNQLERFLNNVFNEIIQLITLVIFAGWSLCMVSLPLGLIGMFPIPFIIWGSMYYQKKVAPFYKQIREGVGHLGTRLENNISGILVIKSFTTEEFELNRVKEVSESYRDANFKAIRWSSVYVPLIRILIAVGFASTLLIGAYWVIYSPGKFSLGSLAFFAMMIQRLLWPVTRLGVIFDDYERARASARRVFGLLDAPNEITSPENAVAFPKTIQQIVFDDVDFSYNQGQNILNQLNLHIDEGQILGIAGPTGGGKTTLIKLLLRLYDVSSGAIKIGNIDIRSMDLKELRQHIALVSQEIYLFHGSIAENINYGSEKNDMQTIIEAAQKAELHDYIMSLPDQYQSIIGERGIRLSGGQRQRLSIARAILKNAPILILDEATSAVDTETERAIQTNLNQLTQGKTALIIAHRLSTIKKADKTIIIKDGKITEEGTHQELIKQNGIYADLWKIQTGEAQNIE